MKVLMCGEMRVSEHGLVHQPDFARALNAERLTALPKDPTDVRVVVGKLLGGRKPATLVAAEKKGVLIVTVDDMLDQASGRRLLDLLQKKEKLEPYEVQAVEALQSRGPAVSKKRRSKKATKAA